jgi:hypothetical protein
MAATANPAQGVRVERIPGKSIRLTEAGRIAVPLWVVKDGNHVGDADLVLTVDEAATMHAQLAKLLTPVEAKATGEQGARMRREDAEGGGGDER